MWQHLHSLGRSAFSPTILLAVALMTVILMMILPMPSWALDLGLAFSFCLAILIFTVTLFIERPLDFSAFPTLLLASLMLRLSLNVSSTKLIIGEGHNGTHAAGNVIQSFANFVMGGSVFLGLVVFGILMIVNFAVITKGAGRMAEVGARFALDAMPGKQLAIDSDVAAGAIDHEEAKLRRNIEQQETTFFGSLDGASKFVKGDAIAGLLITFLNLVMGLTMGLVVHQMPLSEAFETYAILTVGDGLVSQIPAVIISISAALLLARGGTLGSTDVAVFAQISRYPEALIAVAVLMVIFASVPGLPALPFLLGAFGLGVITYTMKKSALSSAQDQIDNSEPVAQEKSIGDIIDLEDIHVEFATDLVPMILDQGTGLDIRISNMRRYLATQFGLILPQIRLTDDVALPEGKYVIRLQGVEYASATIRPSMIMALLPDGDSNLILGSETKEPVYGAPAKWVDPAEQEELSINGITVVTPSEILATHLLETLKFNFSKLMTLRALYGLLDELTSLSDVARSEANQKLFDALIPEKVTMARLLATLQALLAEQVSVRNLPAILESMAETSSCPQDIVVEQVRQKLGHQIIAALKRPDGSVPLLQLAPEWEETFSSYQIDKEPGVSDVALPPDIFNNLAENIFKTVTSTTDQGTDAALITTTKRRKFIKTILRSRGLRNHVIAFEELGFDAKPAVIGTISA